MSTVNLLPNAVVLASPALNATFEKWQAQVNSSGFYIAVETDSTGLCLSVLASQSPEPVRDLWAYLPIEARDPIKAILSPPSTEIKQRTLHIACHDSQHR